jgi:hypothetical protein
LQRFSSVNPCTRSACEWCTRGVGSAWVIDIKTNLPWQEPALHAQREHAFAVQHGSGSRANTTVQASTSLHGTGTLFRNCPLRDVTPVASLSPPNRKHTFYSGVSSSSSSLAQFAEFSLPLFTRKSFSATESWFHRLQLLLLLLFPKPPVN